MALDHFHVCFHSRHWRLLAFVCVYWRLLLPVGAILCIFLAFVSVPFCFFKGLLFWYRLFLTKCPLYGQEKERLLAVGVAPLAFSWRQWRSVSAVSVH